ncbi:hypothetical protein B602_0760 [Chlamydia psittaci M56]|nr:hypothetical protein B602_0760 [Chlamydia psittaci M56]
MYRRLQHRHSRISRFDLQNKVQISAQTKAGEYEYLLLYIVVECFYGCDCQS